MNINRWNESKYTDVLNMCQAPSKFFLFIYLFNRTVHSLYPIPGPHHLPLASHCASKAKHSLSLNVPGISSHLKYQVTDVGTLHFCPV